MMEIHFTVEESHTSANDVLGSEIDQIVQHIRTAVAPRNFCLKTPHDDEICIGKMFETTIDGVKVPCVALIPSAVIRLAGLDHSVTRRLKSVLVPDSDGRWSRTVSINGVPLRCFVIRLSDYNKSVDGSHLNDDVRRIIDLVRAAIMSDRYYLMAPKLDRVWVDAKVTVMIDGATLTSDGLAKIVEDRKELERRIERVFLHDGPTTLAGGLGVTALNRSCFGQHDLDELLKKRRDVITQTGHRLTELDDVIDKVSVIIGLGRVKEVSS
jgi:hypothetical protein